MKEPIRVLIVEDSEDDTLLIVRELERGGYKAKFERVDTAQTMKSALDKKKWDMVISDYKMPRFNGIESLRLLREKDSDLPFIVVSGTIGEEIAVEMLRAGANDYLMKNNLTRFVPAVERALHDAKLRKERKAAQEALQASENKYRTLLENLPQKIFLKDRKSVYVSCNQNLAADLKIKPEEILGKTDYDFVPEGLAEKYMADDKKIIDSGKSEEFDERYVVNGQEMFIHTVKTPVKDESGNVLGILGIFWDITARKKAEKELKETHEQLVQAEKLAAVGQLASGVAHEVKNPLGIILQSVEYLEKKTAPDKKDEAEILEMIKNAVTRADKVVRGLLDFSRTPDLELQSRDINSLIDRSIALVQHELKFGNIQIVKDFESGLPPVSVDENQMHQVFVNIILNSIQAMPEGGRLVLKTTGTKLVRLKDGIGRQATDFFKEGETAVVAEISDTGVGIPQDKMGKVFEPFFTTKGTGQGVGLGMPVVKSIVDIHRGLINVESKVGEGTRIRITLRAEER